MSYDYNYLVQQIQRCRQNAATASSVITAADNTGPIISEYTNYLRHAVETFEILSNHCPMTPILWIQYATTLADFVRAATTTTTTSNDGDTAVATAAAASEAEATAEQTRLSILQLGLQEFPGYALLHLYYLQVLTSVWSKQQQQQRGNQHVEEEDATTIISDEMVEEALETAIEAIGRGSHRNEGTWIAALYQLQAEFYYASSMQQQQQYQTATTEEDVAMKQQRIAQVFIQRSLVPIKGMNDSLADEWYEFLKSHPAMSLSSTSPSFDPQHVLQCMEENRRLEAKIFQPLVDLEDDIDVVMNQCEILSRFHLATPSASAAVADSTSSNIADKISAIVDWEPLLQPGGAPQYGMGMGDASVANAFCKYAQTVHQKYCCTSSSSQNNSRSNSTDNDHHNDDGSNNETESQCKKMLQDRMPNLVISIYERGVAECPTVESIWLSYLDHLQNEMEKCSNNNKNNNSNGNDNKAYTSKIARLLPSVARRACRNCPYSLTLVQLELRIQLVLSNVAGCIILDPDKLVQIAQQALATGFLPDNATVFFQVYRTVIQIIKRRILFLLASLSSSSSSSVEYDQAISPDKKKSRKKPTATSTDINDAVEDKVLEEVSDLCDDLEELYDTFEADLIKKYKQDQSGRVLVLQDWALTQAHVLSHVRKFIRETNNNESSVASVSVPPLVQSTDEEDCFMRRLEKATRVHNPPHPDTFLLWIRYYMTTPTPDGDSNSISSVQELVVRHLCRVRGLFEMAIHQVGRPKAATTTTDAATASSLMPFRDFDSALASLGHEWLEFENTFGSDKSLDRATKAIQKKSHKLVILPPAMTAIAVSTRSGKLEPKGDEHLGPTTTTGSSAVSNENKRDKKEEAVSLKRAPETDIHKEATKKRKIHDKTSGNDNGDNVDHDENQQEMHIKNETELPPKANDDDDGATLKKKSNRPKVLVGELEFPAHPFTVRVSNLTDDTVDMDLVDLLRPKCGAIVHARIVRERGGGGNRHDHQHHMAGKSKGWGLVQFEEREAVEKALALTDTLGLHEKLLQIERSHMPAVSLIPPGMHRVKPKGEGRNSKRNEIRKSKTADTDRPRQGSVEQEGASQSKAQGVEKSIAVSGGTKDHGSVLGFRPRAIGKSAASRKKFKLNLQKEENK